MKKENKHTVLPVKSSSPSRFHGFQMLIVQSMLCIFMVLILVLLQLSGSDVFTELSSSFQSAMTKDVILSSHDTIPSTIAPLSFHADIETPVALTVSAKSPTIVSPLKKGQLTSSFGDREDPFGGDGSEIHEGVDISADIGTPLFAMMDGIVSVVDYEENGYGHYVSIKTSEGNKYVYAHCSAVHVSVGDPVTSGDHIADVGNSGRTTGPHVHIEWIVDGIPIDPLTVIPESAYVSM